MSEKLFAGIDIGATNIKFGLIDGAGDIKFRDQELTPPGNEPEEIFKKVQLAGERLLIEADNLEGAVDFIGVGSPGSIEIEKGIVQGSCPNLPGWVGFPLRERLSRNMNLPVFIDNDANCAALAEFRFGSGRGYENIICLTIGTGIGGGLIINGQLYRGANFSAGEVGHIKVCPDIKAPDETVLLEQLVSSRAIIRNIREKLESNMTGVFRSIIGDNLEQLSIRKIFTALRRKDPVAVETVAEAGVILGCALAGLVNVLNPEVVILGGGVAEGDSGFVDQVKETINKEALPSAVEDLRVAPAQLGNAAGFIGAAVLDI